MTKHSHYELTKDYVFESGNAAHHEYTSLCVDVYSLHFKSNFSLYIFEPQLEGYIKIAMHNNLKLYITKEND